jgi:ADP-heptose:LPS heptosyltransferase
MRFLVFALQGLGDALEATPILHAIRAADSAAEIDVAVTRAGPARLFRGIPEFVANVVELPYWERGPRGFLKALAANAWRRRYDASFMAYPSAKLPYHIVNAAFRARKKIGHRYLNPTATNFLWSYTDLVPIRDVHNVERNLDLLIPAGLARPERGTYVVPPAWHGDGERDARRVTIHIGTAAHDGFENRRWPLANFAEVARALRDADYDITLLSGPDELEETRRLGAEVPGSRTIVGSLEEAARHLASSAVVLTNDSGIGHLSAAVGARVVSLFGPTPTNHAPYGPTSFPLRPSDCPPCFRALSRGISCERDIDYRCLKVDLTVAYVLERLYAVLERQRVDI